MSLKLLVSSIIETEYYLTLDSDVLLHSPISPQSFVRGGRAIFDLEERDVHLSWWSGSAQVLGVAYSEESEIRGPEGGFGVTPAVMSTAGALITLGRLHAVNGDNGQEKFSWLRSWDSTWWSEYTLYRISLDHSRTFRLLHDSPRSRFPPEGLSLACGNVWFEGDTWEPRKVFEKREREEVSMLREK